MTGDSTDRVCLNCGTEVSGNFCPECGQSIETHRFHARHIFTNDFLKKLFYYDKGLFYSLKELYTRPGHSVHEYIGGKRVSHLHYFSLFIVLIFLFKLTENVTTFHYSDLITTDKESIDFLEEWLKHNAKLFYISLIPIYALASFLIFKNAKLNYAEHFVSNTFRSSALLLFTIMFLILAIFIKDYRVLSTVNHLTSLIMIGYGVWFYYQLFSHYYSNKFVLLIRSIISIVLPLFIMVLSLALYLNYCHQ
jgi:hypothetical protein